MSLTTFRTWIYGELVTAAMMNQQIRDNGNAIWVGTTAGDMEYYTGATTKARIPKGTAGQALKMNSGATAPEWSDIITTLVTRRQGGSATEWSTQGTTNYTPGESIIQCGTKRISISSTSQNVTITFPIAFAYSPIIFLTNKLFDGAIGGDNTVILYTPSVSKTNFAIAVSCDSNFDTNNTYLDVFWLAIGKSA